MALIGLGAAGVLLGASPARAEGVTLAASKDTTILEDAAGSSNGSGDYVFAGPNGRRARRRALIAFNVAASLPPGARVTAATLTLLLSRGRETPSVVSLHRLTASWGEGASDAEGQEGRGASAATGDATWTHRSWPSVTWSAPGGDFLGASSATSEVAALGSYTWTGDPLTADVQTILDQPSANHGWIVIAEAVDGAAKRFDSRNNTAASGPRLHVEFDPPAEATGGCCFADGNCGVSLAPGDACNGTYLGDGSTCEPNLCPEPTGACCTADAAGTCAIRERSACDPTAWQGNAAVCEENTCPAVLEPFVDPLPRPAVATPIDSAPGESIVYHMNMVQRQQQLHRDLPPTTVWGFDDGKVAGYPGPTIEASSGAPIIVTWGNELRDATGALLTRHHLPVDHCVHGAADTTPRTVVHLHGGRVPAEFDGYPEDTLLPGETVDYHYPNAQRAATLWYHDHAVGITRLNVIMGLAGFYLIRDREEKRLGLPSGEHEVALAIQDRTFNADGSFRYPASWQDTFFGNSIVVNGKVSPYLEVDRGRYRFRLLNGSTSRAYQLYLASEQAFLQVGNDGGLLPESISTREVVLAPGERADIVIDFRYSPREVILRNRAPSPFPNGGDGPDLTEVIKFIVKDVPGHVAPVPLELSQVEGLDEDNAVVTRDFELERGSLDHCGNEMWTINGKDWDEITEEPHLGTSEVWRFINRSGVTHPMHLHAVFFQVLDRQPFKLEDDQVVLQGDPKRPSRAEAGWKDTVQVGPFEVVRIIARFDDYAGLFPYHCHLLEHEDHGMMRQFEAVAVCGDNAPARGYEDCDDGNTEAGDGCDESCALEDMGGAGAGGAEPRVSDRANVGSGDCTAAGDLATRSRLGWPWLLAFALVLARRARNRRLAASALLVVLCVSLSSNAYAGELALAADRDTSLFEDINGTLSNGAGQYAFMGQSGDGLARRALVRFDLSAIPSGAIITAASLTLNVSHAGAGTPTQVTMHRVSAAWGEGTSNSGGSPASGGGQGAPATAGDATWLARFHPSTPWVTSGGDYSSSPSAAQQVAGTGIYTWTGAGLVSDLQQWANGSAPHQGWLLKTDELGTGTAKRFNTRENQNTVTRPILNIAYTLQSASVPMPRWPGALLVPGLLWIALRRRSPRTRPSPKSRFPAPS